MKSVKFPKCQIKVRWEKTPIRSPLLWNLQAREVEPPITCIIPMHSLASSQIQNFVHANRVTLLASSGIYWLRSDFKTHVPVCSSFSVWSNAWQHLQSAAAVCMFILLPADTLWCWWGFVGVDYRSGTANVWGTAVATFCSLPLRLL